MKIRLLAATVVALALLLVVVSVGGVLAEDGVNDDHFLFLPLIMRPLPAADLSVSISSNPLTYTAGEPLTYTVTVGNAGSTALTALTLDLDIPKVITGTTFTPTVGTYNVLSGTWEGFTLTAGQEATLQVVGSVSSTFTGTLWTTATVAPQGAYDPDLTNNGVVDVNPLPLKNPGFEEEHWWETYYGENGNMSVPEHWIAWWTEDSSRGLGAPESVRVIDAGEPAFVNPVPRILSGQQAVRISRAEPWEAGFYQRVVNLPAGSRAEFSIYAHTWSCNEQHPEPPATSCGDPWGMWLRVGIDPTGGEDPWSEEIVWTENYYIYDLFAPVGPISTEVGEEGAVTLYLYAGAKWVQWYNEAYWDDAALTIRPAAP
jgi:hypothetical protein